ncbi:hypothetical protein M0R88_00545 [Halorussus gelatinilyticus]|uniref:Uncharacterized protein n=1 Tax=Halorussus gelatinilyticus TaxID=2937524 RepID=A0A8U0IHP4_9EURY|nr:hypothetical protein [Halorussus gelatinilyticus]UPW00607.1 hypothetical protein M0R88_00545 [Halorussus gelatinilyticus]
MTVENTADERFVTNHYRWTLQKWDGGRWRRIAPLAVPGPLHRIPPGESHEYRLSPTDGVARGQDAYFAESDITIGGLGPGVYGLSMRGYFESVPDTERVAAAVFGFAGSGNPIRPTNGVTSVTRDGSSLIVRSETVQSERETLTASFVEGAADVPLLPEHVRQLAGLLNTLSYAPTEGVDTVRYVGRTDDVQLVETYLSAVTPSDATRYGFRDYTFELSVGE